MKSGNIMPNCGQRLKQLRKSRKMTQNQVSDVIGCDVRAYRDWETSTEGVSMRLDSLVGLANLFQVSTDYILGRTDVIHVGNDEIQTATGLSEKAIEVLRHVSSEKPSDWNDVATENYHTIEALNYLLEDCYDEVLRRGKKFYINSIFRDIAHYIFPDLVKTDGTADKSLTCIDTKGSTLVYTKGEMFAEYAFHLIMKELDYFRDKNKEQGVKK